MEAPHSSVVAQNSQPGGLGQSIEVLTNTYGICLLNPTTIYAYDVNIVFGTNRQKVIQVTKKSKDDFIINQRRERAIKIFRHLLNSEANFFGDSQEIWYDGQSLLFSKKNFFDGDNKMHKKFYLEGSVTGESNIEQVLFELVASARRSFVVDQNTIQGNTASTDLAMNDRSIIHFLELALNQYVIMNPDRYKCFPNGKTFFCNPANEGFTERDCPLVGDGKRLYVGSKKSVKMIEGPQGRGYNNPSVVVDPMKAAFHETMTVIAKANQITGDTFEKTVSDLSLRKLSAGLRGLGCVASYLPTGKVFEIDDVSSRTANTYAFEYKDGKSLSVADYFRQHRSIELRYPNAPLLLIKEGNKVSAVPMELAEVLPFQRVTIPQQTSEQSQKTTKEAVIPPKMRAPNTQKIAAGLQLFNPENKYISNSGIQVWEKPISLSARVLPSPSVSYNGETVRVTAGKWRPGRAYMLPSSCDVWAVYRVSATRPEDEKNMQQFAQMYHNEMKKKGMMWPPAADTKCVKEEHLESVLADAHKHKCKFVLLISPDTLTTVHKKVKLLERQFGMVIQDSRASNVFKVVTLGKTLTVENMVAKTNLKMGGLNYHLEMKSLEPNGANWISPKRLIVGFGMSHPPSGCFGGSIPTTVGFTANFDSNPNKFVGDFLFQKGHKVEITDVIHEILSKVISIYKSTHSGHGPSELIIYRSGAEQGHFPEILQNEIPQARETLTSLKVAPKLVYIVVNKGQSMRFFKKVIPDGRPTEQNIPPGTVVDTVVSHPSHKEFYLNSHTTLQGSASTPLYSVVLDELNMEMNQLEGLTYALAHNHQIVVLTTSLPAPVYIALEYAKRGSYLFTEYLATLEESQKEMVSNNYTELNMVLSYGSSAFSSRRVNA